MEKTKYITGYTNTNSIKIDETRKLNVVNHSYVTKPVGNLIWCSLEKTGWINFIKDGSLPIRKYMIKVTCKCIDYKNLKNLKDLKDLKDHVLMMENNMELNDFMVKFPEYSYTSTIFQGRKLIDYTKLQTIFGGIGCKDYIESWDISSFAIWNYDCIVKEELIQENQQKSLNQQQNQKKTLNQQTIYKKIQQIEKNVDPRLIGMIIEYCNNDENTILQLINDRDELTQKIKECKYILEQYPQQKNQQKNQDQKNSEQMINITNQIKTLNTQIQEAINKTQDSQIKNSITENTRLINEKVDKLISILTRSQNKYISQSELIQLSKSENMQLFKILNTDDDKLQLAKKLYSKIRKREPKLNVTVILQITKMILELDNAEILQILKNDNLLEEKIDEAKKVLRQVQGYTF